MLIGVTPFFNRNKNILFSKIQTAKVVFPDRARYKIDYSDKLMDLIVKLLDKDKSTRLGANGDWKEILKHPVFEGVDVEQYENR